MQEVVLVVRRRRRLVVQLKLLHTDHKHLTAMKLDTECNDAGYGQASFLSPGR